MFEIPPTLNPASSIQARLSLVAGGAALLLVAALSFWEVDRITDTVKEMEGRRVAELAFQMAGELDRSMHSRKHEIAFFSSMIRFRQANFSPADKRDLLDKIKEEHPIYAWMGVTDAQGTIIAGTGGLLEGVNVAQRDYFIHGQHGFFAGDVHEATLLAKFLPKPENDLLPLRLVDVAMPIHDPQGKFIGVLVGHMNWEWSSQARDRLLNRVVNSDTADIFVLSSRGKVLLGPDDYQLNTRKIPAAVIEREEGDALQHFVSEWPDGQYLTGYSTGKGFQDYPGLGWRVLVRESTEVAFQSAHEVSDKILIAGVAAMLAMGLLGWHLTGYVLRPLRQIAQAAERMRRGEGQGGIPRFKGHDEAAILSESLGSLVDELQGSNALLEGRVRERTRELAQKAQMIDQVSDAILLLDMERNIRECNAGAAKMSGYPVEELRGRSIRDFYPREDWERIQKFIAAELSNKDLVELPVRYIQKSGEIRSAHALFKLTRDEGGLPEGILLFLVDTTARQAMEERFALSQQIAHYGLWDWNIRTGDLAWTDEIYRIFGLEPQQFLANYPAFVERIHPDDQDAVGRAVQEAVESGKPYEIEHRIVKPDGEVRYVLEKGEVYRDVAGKPIRMVGVVHDITEQKTTRKQLELFSQMIERSNDPVYLMDANDECRLTYVNEAAVKHWKVARETLLSWHLADWDPHFSVDKIPGLIDFARNNPGALIETEHHIGDGSMVPVSVSANLLELDGRIYLFGYFKDISERKRIERELAQAKDQAEAANEAKSYFLANMSHEIRTPMNAIIGFSHLCLQSNPEPTQRDYLQKIHHSANSLLGIINDILDFSKIESGKLEVEKAPFELDDVLDSIAAISSVRAEEKGLEFLIDKALTVPQSLIGDSLRLGQVLNNLTSNAVKFTGAGEVHLRVEVVEQTAQQVNLRFTVSDTGVGLTSGQIESLFQSFSQADASTSRKYGGTGLGLAICKRLVELMGGHIWVESVPGEGSQFMFEAPFAKVADVQRTLPDLGNMRMLLIEDNISAQRLTLSYLESFGVAAVAASTAREGLEALRLADESGQPFSDVLLDWSLPDMPGLEVAKRIRQQLPLRRTPRLIYLTGHTQGSMAGEAVSGNLLDASISKPYTPSRLYEAIMGSSGQRALSQISQSQIDHDELAGLRVLLVEDNEFNQQLAGALLARVGIRFTIAGDGIEALAALARQDFDAVLMDMQMPNMDGLEATRQIRKNPAWAELPIIAMTANAMQGDRERCIAAGMNDYISKPIHYEVLYATLARRTRHGVPPAAPVHAMLDADKATANMGGQDIYLSVLEKFVPNQGGAAEAIRNALAAGDTRLAERVAHTLKGIAATIGATSLCEASTQLDEAIRKEASTQYDTLLETVKSALGETVVAVEGYLKAHQSAPTQTQNESDPAQVASLREELARQLRAYDSEAGDTMRQLRQHIKGTALEARYAKLDRCIGSYDYENALTEVLRIAEEGHG